MENHVQEPPAALQAAAEFTPEEFLAARVELLKAKYQAGEIDDLSLEIQLREIAAERAVLRGDTEDAVQPDMDDAFDPDPNIELPDGFVPARVALAGVSTLDCILLGISRGIMTYLKHKHPGGDQ